MAPLRLLPQRR